MAAAVRDAAAKRSPALAAAELPGPPGFGIARLLLRGIDDPARRAAARDVRNARDIGYHLTQMRKQRGMTQAEVARAMGVSQARISLMEHGEPAKMQVESIAAYVTAVGGHLRLVADFGDATTTFIDYTEARTA